MSGFFIRYIWTHKPDIDRCIRSIRDKLGFYAGYSVIQIQSIIMAVTNDPYETFCGMRSGFLLNLNANAFFKLFVDNFL